MAGAELTVVQVNLRSLLVSSPTPLTVRELLHDYRNQMGETVPYRKFGYDSLITFLKERCSSHLVLTGDPRNPIATPVIEERTRHLNDLISKQRIPSSAKFRGKRSSVFLKPKSNYSSQKSNVSLGSTQHNDHNISHGAIRKHTFKYNEKEPEERSIMNDNKKEPEKRPVGKDNEREPEKRPVANDNEREPEKRPVANDNEREPEKRPVANDNEREPEKRPVTKEDKTQQQPSSTQGTRKLGKPSLSHGKKIAASKEIKLNLKQLMEERREGMWLDNLSKQYRERFDCDLDYGSVGYSSVASMCRDMSDTVRLESSATPGRMVVLGARAENSSHVPLPSRTPSRPYSYQQEISGDSDDALPGVPYDKGIFPEDCMGNRESIPSVSAKNLKVGQLYEVNVSEVLDPSHFWFQLRSEEHDLALDQLMDEMQAYYITGEGRGRVMEFGAVQVGQYCATNFGIEGWHRSLIVQVVNSKYVKVRHVDYGSLDTVARGELRVLLREYAALPTQALRGCLARLCPAGGASCWMHEAAMRFHALIDNKPVYAMIHSISQETSVVRMFLIDTNSTEDVHIHDMLVKEKHASYTHTDQEILEDYLLPSFEDCENGRAMNLTEKCKLVAAGIFPEIDLRVPVVWRSHQEEAHSADAALFRHTDTAPATMHPHNQTALAREPRVQYEEDLFTFTHTIPFDNCQSSSKIFSEHVEEDPVSMSNLSATAKPWLPGYRRSSHTSDDSTVSDASKATLRPKSGCSSQAAYASMCRLNDLVDPALQNRPLFRSVIDRKIALVKPHAREQPSAQLNSESRETSTTENFQLPEQSPASIEPMDNLDSSQPHRIPREALTFHRFPREALAPQRQDNFEYYEHRGVSASRPQPPFSQYQHYQRPMEYPPGFYPQFMENTPNYYQHSVDYPSVYGRTPWGRSEYMQPSNMYQHRHISARNEYPHGYYPSQAVSDNVQHNFEQLEPHSEATNGDGHFLLPNGVLLNHIEVETLSTLNSEIRNKYIEQKMRTLNLTPHTRA